MSSRATSRIVLLVLAAALLGPGLAACGKKADLDPPPGAPKERTYPKPQ